MNLRSVTRPRTWSRRWCWCTVTSLHGRFASGVGAFGPGNRANAHRRAAVQLVRLHVAARPAPGDAATHGQPAKYTFCAPRTSASPWRSCCQHARVELPGSPCTAGEGPHNVHDMEKDGDPQLILDKIARRWRRWA
jgi:hypothetical protein